MTLDQSTSIHANIEKHLAQKDIIEDDVFLQLFRMQAENNQGYRNWISAQAIDSQAIDHWHDIPALPTDSFKSIFNPTCLQQDQWLTTFLTSGTTTETKGAHHFESTALYNSSILAGWNHCALPELHQRTLILTPSANEAPNSSLSHMMETLQRELCPSAEFVLHNGELDLDQINECISGDQPVTLLGTALAFLNLFDQIDPVKLPANSWAMETGGYKGSSKSLTKEELYQLFKLKLGLKEYDIWNEYSMTELSSQCYTYGIGKPHTSPPWMRIKVINPETQEAVEAGEMGYLVIYDLANVDSCQAILTQDLAIYHDPQSFTLIGRDPSALPRGCSRSISYTTP